MLRLDTVIKPWKDAAALNDFINLYGFWDETTFLTKSGDLGMVLSMSGIDYESLDSGEQEYAVKRLEAARRPQYVTGGGMMTFQSTLPASGATAHRRAPGAHPRCFNPRSPRGERRRASRTLKGGTMFQSTLPA